MSVDKPDSLPNVVIDEAWAEYVYPRAAIGELSEPHPQSGFTRAMRVLKNWATEHDKFWSGLVELTEQRGREFAAAELESLATEMERSPGHLPVTAEDVRARAQQLREDRKAGA